MDIYGINAGVYTAVQKNKRYVLTLRIHGPQQPVCMVWSTTGTDNAGGLPGTAADLAEAF